MHAIILLVTIIVTILFLAFRRAFFIVTVIGESMMPTLLPGDRLLALRVWPRHSTPRGAMLILRTRGSSWGDTARNISEMYLVKRLIGVPGDSISVGASAVDCVKVDGRGRDSDENGAVVHRIKLGKNEIFVLGDSPKSGFDSYTLGPFPLSSIQAVVLTKL